MANYYAVFFVLSQTTSLFQYTFLFMIYTYPRLIFCLISHLFAIILNANLHLSAIITKYLLHLFFSLFVLLLIACFVLLPIIY